MPRLPSEMLFDPYFSKILLVDNYYSVKSAKIHSKQFFICVIFMVFTIKKIEFYSYLKYYISWICSLIIMITKSKSTSLSVSKILWFFVNYVYCV